MNSYRIIFSSEQNNFSELNFNLFNYDLLFFQPFP